VSSQDEVLDLLAHGELTVEGRVVAASNLTLYARVDRGEHTMTCVYKPVSGERPLWDFPDGTLAGREVAAYLVSRRGGWDLVPPTVLRDGPLGPGMCQQWVLTAAGHPPVDVVPRAEQPRDFTPVVEGHDASGRAVVLGHRDEPLLRAMAVLDAVLNNADRKGGHILRIDDGRLVGVDHGLCFHVDPKLRTVLWGWRGQPLTELEQGQLAALLRCWEDDLPDALAELISRAEVRETATRIGRLLESGRLPEPTAGWPAIPWPAF
jgi:uncharacterized repeat protein (TIGR03843 family)